MGGVAREGGAEGIRGVRPPSGATGASTTTKGRIMRRFTARSLASMAGLVLLLGACSQDGGSETSPTAGEGTGGTEDGPDGQTGDDGDAGTAEDVDAARFVACLQAGGAEAKVSDRGGFVLVRQPGSQLSGEGGSISSEDFGGAEIIYAEGGEDGSWMAVLDSSSLGADPDLQDAYAACETEYPGFEQPGIEVLEDDESADLLDASLESAREFALCAREAGFSWVADPDPDMGGGIELPADLTEAEFRAALEACYDPASDGFGWVSSEELGFDWMGVLSEQGDGPIVSRGGA